MEQLLKYKLIIILLAPLLIIFLILFLIMASTGTILNSPELVLTNFFDVPFEDDTTYVITSKYGERLDPMTNELSFHSGIDLAVPEGTNVINAYPGKVIKVGYEDNGLGEYIKIQHMIENDLYMTVYGHLKKDSTLVKEGDSLSKNTVISLSGNTGKSTGPHLHFEVHLLKKDETLKKKINPINIFEK